MRSCKNAEVDLRWRLAASLRGNRVLVRLSSRSTRQTKRLGLVWSYEVGDGGGDQEATPLVWNNTIFGVTNWSIVFAVDARTGKEKWRWDPEVNRKPTSDKMCCGVVNRGLALYNGKIYVPSTRLQRRRETGKPVWEARVSHRMSRR